MEPQWLEDIRDVVNALFIEKDCRKKTIERQRWKVTAYRVTESLIRVDIKY